MAARTGVQISGDGSVGVYYAGRGHVMRLGSDDLRTLAAAARELADDLEREPDRVRICNPPVSDGVFLQQDGALLIRFGEGGTGVRLGPDHLRALADRADTVADGLDGLARTSPHKVHHGVCGHA